MASRTDDTNPPPDGLESFAQELSEFTQSANFFFSRSADERTIRFLAGTDLGAANRTLSADPEKRAIDFILERAPAFGLKRADLTEQLFLKHTLTSRMGYHLILGLRPDNIEVQEHAFVVHLDQAKRVVMVCANYKPTAVSDLCRARRAPRSTAQERAIVQDAIRQVERARNIVIQSSGYDRTWFPESGGNPTTPVAGETGQMYKVLKNEPPPSAGRPAPSETPRYLDGYQIKGYCLPNQAITIYAVPGDAGGSPARVLKSFYTAPGSSPQLLAVAWIYSDLIVPTDPVDEDEFFVNRPHRAVVLRDLAAADRYEGRYVRVEDQIFTVRSSTVTVPEFEPPLLAESVFDRGMAYYHVDLIQRYFRLLGLDALDTYPELNPLRVMLDGNNSLLNNQYNSEDKTIHVRKILRKEAATYAREPRVLYHEFTHAVTDALCRLNRGDTEFRQGEAAPGDSLQAAAMDEGLADYFACSLAERDGGEPLVYAFMERGEERHVPPPPPVNPPEVLVPAPMNLTLEGRARIPLQGAPQAAANAPQDENAPPNENASQVAANLPGDDDAPAANENPQADNAPAGEQNPARLSIIGPRRVEAPLTWEDVKIISEENPSPENPGDIIYVWGNLWSRYLWQIRVNLGREIADTLIAHSLFFLTRWSTFPQGVLALILADYLLFGTDPEQDESDVIFGGIHEQVIRQAQNIDGKPIWENWKPLGVRATLTRPEGASPYAESADIATQA